MSEREIKVLLKMRDQMTPVLNNVQSSVSDFRKKAVKAFQFIAAAGVAALGAAIGKLALDTLNLSRDSQKAFGTFQAQLGITEQGAQNLTQVATDVWANNFGDSLLDVSDALVSVSNNFEGLEADELQVLTEDALRLRDAFDLQVNETTSTAASLMDHFGLSSRQAFDFISAGMQKGLNRSDDFLDTINEYAPQLDEMNISAEEFFSIMETGTAGGVLGTDKIIDSFKEFRINLEDVGRTEVFEELGINQRQLAEDIENGVITGAEAYQDLFAQISKIEDPIRRNTAITEVFGTQAEDLTEGFIKGIDSSVTSLEDMEGATAKLDRQYENFSDMTQQLWRRLVIRMQPFMDRLLEIAIEILPYVEAAFETMFIVVEKIFNFLSNNKDLVISVLTAIGIVVLATLVPAFIAWAAATLAATWPLLALIGVIAAIVYAILNFEDIINGLWNVVKTVATNMFNIFKENADKILAVFFGPLGIAIGLLITNFDTIKAVAENTFNGMLDTIKRVGEEIERIVNGIKDSINSAISSVENAGSSITDKLPSISLPSIPKFARGGSFVTNGPQLMMVGDNVGGRERVDITPLSSTNFNGPKEGRGSNMNITQNFYNTNIDPQQVASRLAYELQ